LNKNKKIKFDAGYLGVDKIHANSEVPIKGSKLYPLKKWEIKYNHGLSKKRVKVEHVIGKIKFFRIISEKYRNRRNNYDLRMNLICGIYNFELK
jgi:transposase